MPQNDFNPSSYDAVLSKIIEKLDAQDKKAEAKAIEDNKNFATMFAKQDKTNGRVNALEEWKASLKGKITGIAAAVSVVGTLLGWAITAYFGSK